MKKKGSKNKPVKSILNKIFSKLSAFSVVYTMVQQTHFHKKGF